MEETKTIGKTEMIDAIARKIGVPKAKCNDVLTMFFEETQKHVAAGNGVSITGFGSFFPRERAARTGRNPATGATLDIQASVVPAFKAGSAFKSAVAKK